MSAKPTRQTGMLAWLTQADFPLFLFDYRRRVRFFNFAAEKYFACNTADVIGKICHFTAHNPESDTIKKVLHKIAPPPQIFEQFLLLHPLSFAGHPQTDILFLNLEYNQTQTTILGIILPENNAQLRQLDKTSDAPKQIHEKLDKHLDSLLSRIQTTQRVRIQRVPLIAISPQMQLAFRQWQLSLNSNLPVHFYGPLGVGKSTWIQALHYQSPSGDKPFITLEAKLMEYEHLRQQVKMLTKIQDGVPLAGGVHLKLIEELPLDSQRYLLEHFLEVEKNHSPLRWFSSSILSSQQILDQRCVIPELYYHLSTISIELPPLHKRLADLELFVQYFIEESNTQHEHQSGGVTPETLAELTKYQWPGNLTELKGVITEAHAASTSALIKPDELPLRFRMGWKTQALGPRKNVHTPLNLEQLLMEHEREWILWALSSTSGNRAAAAQLLGMTRPRLYRRLEALGLLDETEPGNDE